MAKCINAMWKESMAKGRAEGKAEKSSKFINNMISKGLADDYISDIAEVPVSEVVAIRSSMM